MKRFGCLLVMLAVVLQGAPSARSGRKNDKFAKELNKVNPNDTVRVLVRNAAEPTEADGKKVKDKGGKALGRFKDAQIACFEVKCRR